MISENAIWAILLLPFLSFMAIAFIIRPFFSHQYRLSGYVTITSIGVAFSLSIWALVSVWSNEGAIALASYSWISIGGSDISLGILMDPLTAIMLVVVTGVSFLVQIYSQGYMHEDPSYSRYFAFMSLFTTSMLGLVLASNIIQLYAFWELVGLSSYLLIGFWHERPSATAAAKKAFIVTRLGDVGFLLAILYLFLHKEAFLSQGLSPFQISDINLIAAGGKLAGVEIISLGSGIATWVALGIFAGAVGKSAQFPLHTWLPDAMEGPTPVSALIHAATMVVAGVFLVARFFPLFESSTTAMGVVSVVGGFTAIFAASMGLVMNDIKRVLAYSTVSQLGYMMLALGVGAYEAAIFHLFNHAFFKALLFLGAGSVNHASGTFDMRQMGGLRVHMPITYTTFLIAALSISGIFPLAGFWSKDEVLMGAFSHGGLIGQSVLIMALLAAFMTSFYMFRALFMTFHGESRAQHSPGSGHHGESPATMVIPMIVLAIPSIASGFLANPLNTIWGLGVVPAHWLSDLLSHTALIHHGSVDFSIFMAAVSTLVASSGILLAYLMYYSKQISPEAMANRVSWLYRTVTNKYYFDEIYENWITVKIFYLGLAQATDWVDRNIVDRVGETIGLIGRNFGKILSPIQTGQAQTYGAATSLGVLLTIMAFMVWY